MNSEWKPKWYGTEQAVNVKNRWRKFQYFGFPTHDQNQNYKYLEKIFQLFYSEYIEDQGLKDCNNTLSMSKIFKYTKDPKTDSYITYESKQLTKLQNLHEFNTEDKIWLNRIAYRLFRKQKAKVKYEDFFKYCVNLQV